MILYICFFIPNKAFGATKYLYVGETYQVNTPSASSSNGYIDQAHVLSTSNRLSIDTSDPYNVTITVIQYFSNTVSVTIRFVETYTYNGHVQKVDHDVEVIIGAKYPTIKAVNSTMTIAVGERKKLEYTVTPEGLLPPVMQWGYINQFSYSPDYITLSEDGYVTGKKVGRGYVAAVPYGDQSLAFAYIITVTDSKKEQLQLSASPSSGEVTAGTKVYLSTTNASGADIYYTLNGTTPTKNSTKYTSAGIAINESCTLKAIAYKDGYEASDVLTAAYTIANEEKVIETNCAGIIEGKDGVVYRITGIVGEIANTAFGNWYLKDESGQIYIYGTRDKDGNAGRNNSIDVWGIKTGDYITVEGPKTTYNGIVELVDVTVLDLQKQTDEQLDISVNQLAAGYHSSFFKNDEGILYAWGTNRWGQLGDGSTDNRSSSVMIMEDVSFVNASYKTFIIDKKGSLMACGMGPLGNGNGRDSSVPIKIMDNVSYAEPGNHSLILKRDGTLWAFGGNTYGELGFMEDKILFMPEQIMSDVKMLAVGRYHSLVVKKDGSLWTFGYNIYGQLGDGTTSDKFIPLKIMDNVSTVSAGSNHSLILKKDGTLWGCGSNYHGELGDGSSTNRLQPVEITDDVVSMAAGDEHSLVVKKDGTLWACGSNENGRLGDGTTTDRHELVKVMDNVRSVAAGYDHSLVVKRDGSLWAFGGNSEGQIGDGTTIDRYSPILIMEGNKSLPEAKMIATSSSGYATFFSSESAYTLPNGLSAQVVTGAQNGKLTYKTIADGSVSGVVPKGTAVMLTSDAKKAGTYTLTSSESTTSYSGTNLLRGSDEATTTTGDGLHYKLSYGPSGTTWNDVFGWYWGAQNGVPFQIEGHKAWLVIPRSNGTRAAGFNIEGDVLSIESIKESVDTSDNYYDLQGRRISHPMKSGVYIKNGMKVVIK